MAPEQFDILVRSLVAHPTETEWLEFKLNQDDPEKIGENISALSNAAALHRKPTAYIVWGVEDAGHRIVGTSFSPRVQKIGNEELENWLAVHLAPRIDVGIDEGDVDGRHVVIFEIQPATNIPVRFKGVEHVRVGSYTKKLHEFPEKERALWKTFHEVPFENGTAADNISSDEILSLIDYPNFFRLTHFPLPDSRHGILERLCQERVIHRRAGDRFDITNLGAILFAQKLSAFNRVTRKATRVIIYSGQDRTKAVREQVGARGYAAGFEGLIEYINNQLPQNELIGQALRTEVRMYPEIAIRELVANALIHQDFHITGTGPMIEIFVDRMEIANPGAPLIDTLRFIGATPRSRNETLAALMRRMKICEERGSGIVKVIAAIEAYQLPAPDFRTSGDATVVVLLGPRKFAQMNREDRIRACYQHACLEYNAGRRLSNATLRKRLGIDDKSYPIASRIISDTREAGLIKAFGDESSRRDASYLPIWV